MDIEKIGEPIRVLADFSGGRAEPLRFQWSGRTYKVSRVHARWIDRSCDGYRLHYSVQANGQTCYLHFASDQVQWWLDQLIVD